MELAGVRGGEGVLQNGDMVMERSATINIASKLGFLE
jgi:hypothetical protein